MATAAEVRIINTALASLGQEPVSDLEEASLQTSLAAVKLLRHMQVARDTVLSRHGFTCATTYTTLSPALISGYVNWRYPTVYQLPGDALRVWEIGGICAGGHDFGGWEPRWQCGTVEDNSGGAVQVIRAREADQALNVAYIRRAAWAALDPNVSDAIAYDIAKRGATAVTGDQAIISRAAKDAETKVMLAISIGDTQEGGQPPWMGSTPALIRNMSR